MSGFEYMQPPTDTLLNGDESEVRIVGPAPAVGQVLVATRVDEAQWKEILPPQSASTVNFVLTSTGSAALWKALPVSGQIEYILPGTYSWVCPVGVTSVCVVAVGAGSSGGWTWSSGGGAGGGLGWKNNIAVTPGATYTVVVGAPAANGHANANTAGNMGGNSYFIDTATVCGYGAGRGGPGSTGATPGYGGGYFGDGGGRGGNGAYQGSWNYSGGGAGGYAGPGAGWDAPGFTSTFGSPTPAGGGGGMGGYYSSTYGGPAGGGVGIYGQGPSGGTPVGAQWGGGRGGSGGQDGMNGEPYSSTATKGTIRGGDFGGGGGGSGTSTGGGPGGNGAVRIIWGADRSFPTNAGR